MNGLPDRILWLPMPILGAFVVASMLHIDMSPHRFLLGLPLTLVVLLIVACGSRLAGVWIPGAISSLVSADIIRRGWQISLLVMVVRNAALAFHASRTVSVPANMLSLLLSLIAGILLLADLAFWWSDLPRFDPPRVQGRATSAESDVIRYGFHAWIDLATCVLAITAVLQLITGLAQCLDGRSVSDSFFISELGVGKHATIFTRTLIVFALLLIPLFGTFLLGHGKNTKATALRFAIGGCLSLTGVMGIGIWDLQHPLHYVGILAWLLSTATVLDRSVPIGGRLLDLWIPVWPVQLCIVNYVGSMLLLPFSRTMHSACIVCQRMAVVAMMVWLFMLLRLRIWFAVKSLLLR